MWADDVELSFRTGNKTLKISRPELKTLVLTNAEDARAALDDSHALPYGSWTEGDRSGGGGYSYLVASNKDVCWVMEITQAQVPSARSFVQHNKPTKDKSEGHDVPTRAINTPLGALFTVGSIVCVFAAIALVFFFQQPIIGIIVAIAATVMWFNIK
jgi:hypothetical protein